MLKKKICLQSSKIVLYRIYVEKNIWTLKLKSSYGLVPYKYYISSNLDAFAILWFWPPLTLLHKTSHFCKCNPNIVTYNSNLYQTKHRILCKQPAAMFLSFLSPESHTEAKNITPPISLPQNSSQLDCHKLNIYIYIYIYILAQLIFVLINEDKEPKNLKHIWLAFASDFHEYLHI
jgi:hypothetical protein